MVNHSSVPLPLGAVTNHLHQSRADFPRIGLASGGFHNLTHEKIQRFVVAGANALHRRGISLDHLPHILAIF